MADIIIADDMITVLHNMAFILENNGHRVIAKAHNCSEAIELYRKHKPDILLLDIIGMESFFKEKAMNINSFDVINIILKEDSNAKIIMLTSKENYIERAISLGAKGYLIKGATNDRILKRIDEVSNG